MSLLLPGAGFRANICADESSSGLPVCLMLVGVGVGVGVGVCEEEE